jgi:hypothetical protein
MSWLQQLFGVGGVQDFDRDFQQFLGRPRGIRLHITRSEAEPTGCAMLSLRPDTRPSDPESLMSYIKAKLLCEMPKAIQHVPSLSLGRGPAALVIRYEGKTFQEPAWYVKDAGGTFGPLSFRQGSWNEDRGEYEIWLMQVYNPPFEPNQMIRLTRVVSEVADAYREGVRTFEI